MLDAMARAGGRDFADMTPQEARRAFAQGIAYFGGEAQPVGEIREIGIPCRSGRRVARLYRPANGDAFRGAVLWLHGGGFVFGDLDTYDGLCRALANACDVPILSFDYRLAPEAPFPAAFEDCADAWRWFECHAHDFGADRRRLAIGGDSAGATLAIATSLECPDAMRPGAMLLAYPGTSPGCRYPSHDRFGAGYLLTNRTIDWCLGLLAPHGAARQDPRLVPLAADLAQAPATVLLLAGCDPLIDEGLAFASRLVVSGVSVLVQEHAGMPHGFLSFGGSIPDRDHVLGQLGEAWRGLLTDGLTATADDGSRTHEEVAR
ncbi:Lipase 2 [uncultured bacterium]|nr:Lipase 2 [uncultured bacterium]